MLYIYYSLLAMYGYFAQKISNYDAISGFVLMTIIMGYIYWDAERTVNRFMSTRKLESDDPSSALLFVLTVALIYAVIFVKLTHILFHMFSSNNKFSGFKSL